MSQPTLAAIVLTKNEERDLPACLDSLRGLATEIYVVDSGSTDRTVAVAEEHGARVVSHPFANYATQFNWALDDVPSAAEWVLRIDADERVSDRLRGDLVAAMREAPEDVAGFEMARRVRFLGRELRYGDTYPIWLLRVWRRGAGRCEDTWMDEHIVLRRGKVRRVQGDLIHDIPKDLTEWTAKHNWYASRECQDISSQEAAAALEGQAGTKRWLKQNIYLRAPLFYRALFYWLYRYFLKLGFLDGKQGLVYHFLQGFWYRFLVDAKLFEARAGSLRSTSRSGSQETGGEPMRVAIVPTAGKPTMYREYLYENGLKNGSHKWLRPAIDRELSGLPEGARVLDVGCGNGSLTAAWARRGWDVTGVDPSESGIAQAKASYPGIAFHRMAVGPELIERFGEGSFDAIVSAEVVEHLYSPRDLTSSAFGLLKDGGLLVLTTPYNGYLKNLVLAVTGTMDRHWTALWDGGHIKFWSWGTIRRLLGDAGFIDPEFSGAGRLPFLWKSMVVRAWKPGA